MLLGSRDKKRLKRLVTYLALVILMTTCTFYVWHIPKPIHWTMAVPWALVIILFVAWRMAANSNGIKKKGSGPGGRRVKRLL